jgi:hypothetical protein
MRIRMLLVPAVLGIALQGMAKAEDAKVKEILDKAIKALGGEEKLGAIKVVQIKGEGKIIIEGNDNPIKVETTTQGLDHHRGEFEGEFGGNSVKGVTVLKGDKGWRKFGDNLMEMDEDGVKNEKRNIYLSVIPATILPLRKDFKTEAAPDADAKGKPASGVKVIPPDGKEFTIYFDKETGLPVRQVARVVGFGGEEYEQETLYDDYKEFNGIKKATKLTMKRDGEIFIESKVLDFKTPEKVAESTFSEPE